MDYYSGTRSDGSTFERTITVDGVDPANTSIGDLVAELQSVYGAEATVNVNGADASS